MGGDEGDLAIGISIEGDERFESGEDWECVGFGGFEGIS
jgi:hypothetical protein